MNEPTHRRQFVPSCDGETGAAGRAASVPACSLVAMATAPKKDAKNDAGHHNRRLSGCINNFYSVIKPSLRDELADALRLFSEPIGVLRGCVKDRAGLERFVLSRLSGRSG